MEHLLLQGLTSLFDISAGVSDEQPSTNTEILLPGFTPSIKTGW